MWLRQHIQNLRDHLTEKSEVAQQAYEGHMVGCNKARIWKFKVKAV
jgi:hypothetical protein